MPEIAEMMEQMEHAEHGGSLGRSIGITMAVLGVLLAICSALVGGARTDLIARMVDQTSATMKYEAANGKYRIVAANLVELHAQEPNPAAYEAAEKREQEIASSIPDTATARKLVQIQSLSVSRILNTVVPTHTDMIGFVDRLERLDAIKDAAQEWAESYEGALHAYTHGAENYERAQLCAEIGIVICSIGLLLSSRPMWYFTLLLGVASLVLVGMTWVQVSSELKASQAKITQADHHYHELTKKDSVDDQALFAEIRAGH